MDPNSTLAEIRKLTERAVWRETSIQDQALRDLRTLLRLAELTQALDEWLTSGGFLPTAWAKSFPLWDEMQAKR